MLHLCAICGSAAPPPPCESRLQSMYSKHSGGCWEQCRRASRGGGGRAVWSPCRPLFVSHGSARVVVRGLLVRLLVWLLFCCSCIAGPSLVHLLVWLLLCRSCIAGASLVRLLVWVLLCRSCIAGPSLVHRASVCSSGCSSVPRASCVRLLDSSLLHRWSIAPASLMRRSSACLCTARPSAGPSDGPSVGVTIAAASLGRRVWNQWKARMLFWCCRRRSREGL